MSEFVETRSPAIAPGIAAGPRPTASIESRRSWIAAGITLGLLTVTFGSQLLAVVGLKPITEDLGTARQLVALAGALTWLGTGLGGVVMGPVAERVGIRLMVTFGAAMIALGLAVSASGGIGALLVGHTLFVGFFGNGAMYAPLLVYISRWFDRRRGTALSLIWSGQYIAGIVWPTLFEHAMAGYGWRVTMLGFAAIILVAIPIAALFLRPAPEAPSGSGSPRQEGVARCSACGPIPCWRFWRWPGSAAASRWRSRRAISSRFAAISVFRRPRARQCCR